MTNARPEERKRKPHITAEKNRLQQRKQWPTGPTANSLHTVESPRRRTSCCCSQPVSRMLATVLEWLTDFLTGVIMESRKAARSKAVAFFRQPPCFPVWLFLAFLATSQAFFFFFFFTLKMPAKKVLTCVRLADASRRYWPYLSRISYRSKW